MSLKSRIKTLERQVIVDDEGVPEAVVVLSVDASASAGSPDPITQFSFSGQKIHRLDGETYIDFEARAVTAARECLNRNSGGPAPIPVLIANGGDTERTER